MHQAILRFFPVSRLSYPLSHLHFKPSTILIYHPSPTPPKMLENPLNLLTRNHSLSIRSRKTHSDDNPTSPKHRLTLSSLRGIQQPELSKKLYKLIKSENHAISAYDTAGRERVAIASQLSEWGESTGDDAISEVSDKLGVLLAEIAEQEDAWAQGLEEYRGVMKQIRNTEGSVQPSRDHKSKACQRRIILGIRSIDE